MVWFVLMEVLQDKLINIYKILLKLLFRPKNN